MTWRTEASIRSFVQIVNFWNRFYLVLMGFDGVSDGAQGGQWPPLTTQTGLQSGRVYTPNASR